MAEAALVVAFWNLAVLVALYRKVYAMQQPIGAAARKRLTAAQAAAERARQEYLSEAAKRRCDKDRRQLAAEQALERFRAAQGGTEGP